MIRLFAIATVVWATFFTTYLGLAHEAPQPQQQQQQLQVPQAAPTTTIQNVFGGTAIGECPASNPNVRLMLDYTIPIVCTGQTSACPGKLVCNKDGNRTCSFIPGECNTCSGPLKRYVCLNDEQLKEAEK